MNIVDMLLGEHAVLLSAYAYLEKLCASGELKEILEAVRATEALMAQHAVFEDELLFDELPLQSGGVEDALKAMRREHDSLPEVFAAIYDAPNLADARRALGRLIEFSREHFSLEEHCMFPLAAKMLGPERLEELGKSWARRRQLASATL